VARRRRSRDWAPALVFLALAAGAWIFREELLAPLRPPPKAGPATSVAGPAPESSSEPTLTPAPSGTLEPDQASTGIASSLSENEGAQGPAEEPHDLGSGDFASLGAGAHLDSATGQSPTAFPAFVAAGPSGDPQSSRETSDVERTSTGLKRFSAPPAPHSLPAHGLDDALDAALLAVEVAPGHAGALEALVTLLLERGESDLAHEHVVRFREDGGSESAVAGMAAAAAPDAGRTGRLLERGADRLLDAAEGAEARELWLTAAALTDRAERLLQGARRESGSVDTEGLARVATLRQALASDRDAIAALSAAGAPLPADAVGGDRLSDLANALADARATSAQEESVAETPRARVATLLPHALARQALDVVLAVDALMDERYGSSPLASGEPLQVQILTGRVDLASAPEDPEDAPPDWRRALLHDGERQITVLDPRDTGDELERLWGLLARETARRGFRAMRPDGAPLPPWLEWGLALDREGVRVTASGELELSQPPWHRRAELLASLSGTGPPRRDLSDVLAFDGRDPAGLPFVWAFVTWLGEGAPGLVDLPDEARPLESLLSAHRAGTPLTSTALLREQALVSVEGEAPTLRRITEAFDGWLDEAAGRANGSESAWASGLLTLAARIQQRHWDPARTLLQEALESLPHDSRVWELAVAFHRRKAHTDGALLCALALGEARATPSRSAPASERYAEAVAVQRTLGQELLALDDALRVQVDEELERLLADDRPLAAVRLTDHLAAASPVDGGWTGARARLLDDVLGEDEVLVRRRVPVAGELPGTSSEPELWTGGEQLLRARCADRVEPTLLSGVVPLAAPWRVTLPVRFAQEDWVTTDLRTRQVGLLFGAADAGSHGDWGVILSQDGRVELATRGRLEWPGVLLGRGGRHETTLQVRVETGRLTVLADGKPLGSPSLGSRVADGWLALRVRHADVTLGPLVLERSRTVDPRGVWHAQGGL
jgi:hypothetical protein